MSSDFALFEKDLIAVIAGHLRNTMFCGSVMIYLVHAIKFFLCSI